MFYYIIELAEDCQELCTIVTPFGKFQYCRVPMGINGAPDIAQAIIEEILTGLDVEAYLDDIGIFTNGTYEQHMEA
eukprot:12059543-Ditylum_brightwellii.AAC.1